MKYPRKFQYAGAQKTRFGIYRRGVSGRIWRHEYETRRERDAAWKRSRQTIQIP